MRTGGLESAPDLELGRSFRDGDEAALAALYDRHLPGIYDFLARLVRDPPAAEDLTQMTFVRAWEARRKLRDPARVRAWLYTIANNLALNHLTRRPPTDPIDEQFDLATPAPGPEAEAMANESAELVWAAAASLEPRQYAVLDLSLRRDLATPEIAQVLGVSSSHAAVLVNRAREALGNAVRYLLVAQRRDHCSRLAALVPAGLQSLTAEQRGSVDRHMRRCPECQGLANRLTRPAELFGGLVALPVPSSLKHDRRDFVLVAARQNLDASNSPLAWLERLPRAAGILGGLAVLALGALVTQTLVNPFGASLQASGQTAGYKNTGPFPSTPPVSPLPSPSSSRPEASPTASPSAPSPSAGLVVTNYGVGQVSAGGIGHGRRPTPKPTAVPTPALTPTPAPPTVTSLSVTWMEPPNNTCNPSVTSATQFACHFTVNAGLVNTQAGATVTGTLTATPKLGLPPPPAKFSITVPAGAPGGWANVTVVFTGPPCLSGAGTGNATAATTPPNAFQSPSTQFC
ncbi:MAG: sigma-70 family RNA polymerase sigma factor [Candidatus Dormibacteraeota bacterium]|nr:sigma-70 family RNA polymerase sigma factor [Candidatus Dormibacteraeota bacterium]